MNQQQLKAYVKRGGTGCPVCGSTADIEGQSMDFDKGMCIQEIICLEEDGERHVWYNTYTLTWAEGVTS